MKSWNMMLLLGLSAGEKEKYRNKMYAVKTQWLTKPIFSSFV